MNLTDLSLPFSQEDIEWRVSRAGNGKQGIFCLVIAYITNRAIMKRLDDVCGPENWRNEEPRIIEVNGKSAFACGISIRVGEEWITKWDVAEPTGIEPAKGGWSGAMKRAGSQWGIGRYLYALDETFAEVADEAVGRQWNYAKLPEKHGGTPYYWKAPGLPAWALPRDEHQGITAAELNDLKRAWKEKFAPESRNPKELREGFTRFVNSVCGDFPISDPENWIREAWDKCMARISQTVDPQGPSSDIPFDRE